MAAKAWLEYGLNGCWMEVELAARMIILEFNMAGKRWLDQA